MGRTVAIASIAAVLAVPAGWLIGHTGRGRDIAVALSGGARAVPSFGLVLLLVLLLGVTHKVAASVTAFAKLSVAAGVKRWIGPDRFSAPTRSWPTPKTGADTAAAPGLRSPWLRATRSRRIASDAASGSPAKARSTLPLAPVSGSRAPSCTVWRIGCEDSTRCRQMRSSPSRM